MTTTIGTRHAIRALMALVLLVAWTSRPSPASAEDASVRAANLAESANRLGRTGEYAAALELFEQAYALDPQPVLLYNIGRVAERLKDWKKAAGALRAYIEVATDAEQKAKAEQVLRDVEARLPAWLSVAASVDGAVVEVDGKTVGRTPLGQPLEVSPGRHAVRVLAVGRRPFETTVEVKGTESARVNARLEDLPAVVTITVEPAGAAVTLDGKRLDADSLARLEVAPGEHTVVAEAKGYEQGATKLVVAPGEARSITLALDRLPPPPPLPPPATVLAKAKTSPQPLSMDGEELRPASALAIHGEGGQGGEVWYKKWWVWTVTGAVVAGGVTAAVLLTQGGGGQPALDGEWVVQ